MGWEKGFPEGSAELAGSDESEAEPFCIRWGSAEIKGHLCVR